MAGAVVSNGRLPKTLYQAALIGTDFTGIILPADEARFAP